MCKFCTLLDQSVKTKILGHLKSYVSHICGFASEIVRFGLICKPHHVSYRPKSKTTCIGLILELYISVFLRTLLRISTTNL
jgi:hypothetical protein